LTKSLEVLNVVMHTGLMTQCEGLGVNNNNEEEEEEYVDYTDEFSTEAESERHVTFPDFPKQLAASHQRGDTETSTGEYSNYLNGRDSRPPRTDGETQRHLQVSTLTI
jgi:hypothetical protein